MHTRCARLGAGASNIRSWSTDTIACGAHVLRKALASGDGGHCVSGDTIGRLIGRGHNSAVAHAYDLFVLQLLLKLLHAFRMAIDLAGALICRAVTCLYRPKPSRPHICRCVAASASLDPLPLALRAP